MKSCLPCDAVKYHCKSCMNVPWLVHVANEIRGKDARSDGLQNTDRQTETWTDIQTDRHTDRHTDRLQKTDRQAGRQADRDIKTDKQMHT